MSEPYVGEIRMFAGSFAPRGWAFCDGQLLSVSANDPLFSLLDTIYGGDGQNTFALPDLRGRIPIHAGQGPGLTNRPVGTSGGSETVALQSPQLPAHHHGLRALSTPADSKNPHRRILAKGTDPLYAPANSPLANLESSSIQNSGGGQAHDNLMPYVCVNFIIALVGIYPSRH